MLWLLLVTSSVRRLLVMSGPILSIKVTEFAKNAE